MKNKKTAQVYHFDLYGTRNDKYEFLHNNSLKSLKWNELNYSEPNYFFVKKDFTGSGLYEAGFKIDELFLTNTSGIKTHNDAEHVAFEKFKTFNYNYHYRVFDDRYICYDLEKIVRHRYSVMKNIVLGNNLSFISSRQNSTFDYQHVFISKYLVDINSISLQTKEISYAFPLYLYPEKESKTTSRTPNLNSEIVHKIASGLGLKFTNEKDASVNSADSGTFAPIDILDYIYAVLHSPTYREKYKEFLKIDFPRVPYPKDKETFWKLVKLGGELRLIHLLESPSVEKYITKYPADGDNVVNKIKYQDGKVYINDTQHFEGVPEVAWNFYIGGYQPARKWLKDRKGRKLEFDDILHYQKIIVALTETDRIMKEIDTVEVE